MKFWAGMYLELDKKALEDGVNMMLKVAMDILAAKKIKLSGTDDELQDNQDGGQHKKWDGPLGDEVWEDGWV